VLYPFINAGGIVKQVRILIADDHKEFRKVVMEYLRSLPHVIVVGEANDGVDVVEKTERLDPDFVLMDITMPLRNGLEATKIIKMRWPEKKVVIATMHESAFYRTQAEQAHADGFLLKSALHTGLLAVLGQGTGTSVYAAPAETAGK
jgi:DNA-binding NarL/FixJ family response regulator